MDRPRACAALINDDGVLMVCHQTPSRTYWTLPGGGVGKGEEVEYAVVREVKEETGLDVKVTQLLFKEDYGFGISYCYHTKLAGETIQPTLDFLPDEQSEFGTMLHSAVWHLIRDKKDDIQVSKVIIILGLDYD